MSVTTAGRRTENATTVARLLTTEKTLIWMRWAGGLVAILFVLSFPRPYPPPTRTVALVSVIGLLVANLVMMIVLQWRHAPSHARAIAISGLVVDAGFILALVYAYTFDPFTAIWVVAYLIPLEGATKFQLFGAVASMAVAGVAYGLREALGNRVYNNPISATSIGFRVGIGFVVAGVVGSMARSLVDERRELAAALRGESRTILEASGQGIIGLDRDGRITFANLAAAEMLGWGADDLVGRPGHETFHHTRADGTTYEKKDCPIGKTYRDGEEQQGEGELFWRADGTNFPARFSSTPAMEGTNVAGAVLVFEDTTERIRAHDDLGLARAQLDLVLDTAPVILVAYDSKGVITMSRGLGLELIGSQQRQNEGLSVLEAYRDREDILDFVLRALEGERHVQVVEVAGHRLQAIYQPVMVDGAITGALSVAYELPAQAPQLEE